MTTLLDPRFRDFDAAFSEAEASGDAPKPLSMRLFGEEWTLPADPPAKIILLRKRAFSALRALMSEQSSLPEDERLPEEELMQRFIDLEVSTREFDMWQHASQLVGEANLREWMDRDLGWHRLNVILDWVESEHDGRGDVERSQGNPEAPEEGADPDPPSTSSSNGGDSSKPTSNGSTGST